MFDEPLPRQADLRKLAAAHARFDVTMSIKHLPRFAGAVVGEDAAVRAQLQFAIDDQYRKIITGAVSCDTQVVCQRCMEPVAILVSAGINLAVACDEERARNLPNSMEPLIVAEDELLDLNEVLEDELLLALPFVSYHQPDQCSGRQRYESTLGEQPVVEKENPFSVLEQLKSGK